MALAHMHGAHTHAYCYASGQIGFGPAIPRGALSIATGPRKILMDMMDGLARHAYDGETLLVPGVPEAANQLEAVEALKKWVEWFSKHLPEGVETIYSKSRELAGIDRPRA